MADFLVEIGYRVNADGVKKAREEVDRTNRELNNSRRSARQFGRSMARGAAVAATGIATVTTALAAVISKTLESNQAINDAALFSGDSAENIARLSGALTTVGVQFDQTAQLLNRVNERVNQAVEGSTEFAELFSNIGLDADTLSQQSPSAVLEDIIIAINNIEDASLRARAVNQLLGDSNTEVLKLGSSYEDLSRRQAEAIVRGVTVGEAQLQLADDFDTAKNDINSSLTIIRNGLVQTFGPAGVNLLETFADDLEDNALRIVRISEEAFGAIQKLANAGANAAESARGLLPDLQTELSVIDRNLISFGEGNNVTFRDFFEGANELAENSLAFLQAQELRSATLENALSSIIDTNDEQLKQGQDLKEQQEERQEQLEENKLTFEEFLKLEEERGILFARLEADRRNGEEEQLEFTERFREARIEEIEQEKEINEERTRANQLLREREEANDAAFESLKEIVEEEKAYRDFISDVNSELELQESLNDQILAGNVQNQEEAERFLNEERQLRELINRAKREGVDITDKEVEAILEERRAISESNDELLRQREIIDDIIEDTVGQVGDLLANSIIDGLDEGKFAFEDFLSDLGNLLIRSGIQQLVASIFSPQAGSGGQSIAASFISGLIGGFAGGSSGGGSSGVNPSTGVGVVAAKGETFNGPQTALLGEQGPEAILPLGRDSTGRLGVRTTDQGSSGQSVTINNNITVNGSDNPQETARNTSRALDQLMERKFKSLLINESRSGNLLGGTR